MEHKTNRRILGLGSMLAGALALGAALPLVLPPARETAAQVAARGDPVAETDLALDSTLDAARLGRELDAALAARDADLAHSFVDLAAARGLPVAPDAREKLAALEADSGNRALRDFGAGFASGSNDSGAALAGAIAADVSGYGDLRDLYGEGQKAVRGEAVDDLTVALATVGLGLSVVTWTSLGAALPARGGVSLLKGAEKAGRLSRPLAAALGATAARALDREALAATASAAGRLDFAAARASAGAILRPTAVASFRALGEDTATLYAQTGVRGTSEVLAVAEDSGQLGRAAAIATAKGSTSRAIFKVLGRGALVAADIGLMAASWAFAFVGWLFGLALFCRRLGMGIGRMVWRRRSGRGKIEHPLTPLAAYAASRPSPARGEGFAPHYSSPIVESAPSPLAGEGRVIAKR